jgi:hypothetical protein
MNLLVVVIKEAIEEKSFSEIMIPTRRIWRWKSPSRKQA